MRDIANLTRLAANGARLQALAAPPAQAKRDRRPGISVSNAAVAGRTTVRLYGPIGSSWWDETAVGALDFEQVLDGIGKGGIDLHVNSPGGDVFDAVAMHAALLNHPSDVDVYVNGVAASAASMISMAGDRIVIEKPARFMIHDASGFAYGPAKVVLELGKLLDEISDTIAEMYADRAGGSVTTWRTRMREETWYTARQAVDVGLADEVANDRTAEPPPDEEDADAVEDLRSVQIRAGISALNRAFGKG